MFNPQPHTVTCTEPFRDPHKISGTDKRSIQEIISRLIFPHNSLQKNQLLKQQNHSTSCHDQSFVPWCCQSLPGADNHIGSQNLFYGENEIWQLIPTLFLSSPVSYSTNYTTSKDLYFPLLPHRIMLWNIKVYRLTTMFSTIYFKGRQLF